MKCFGIALATSLVVALTVTASAQQLETNSPGGSLRSQGLNPIPGSPFRPGINGTLNFTVGGPAGNPFALVFGQLATTSLSIPLTTEFFDLNQAGAVLVVNGFGPGGGLPSFFSLLNGNGQASFSFPLNPSLLNVPMAFQGFVADFTLPPININLTAAAEFVPANTVNQVVVTADDLVTNYPIPSGSITLNGQTFSSFDVDTNGWIKFGSGAFTDLSESNFNMINGLMGGATAAPGIAVLWRDLDVGNGLPGQNLTIDEPIPGIITVTWNNADFYPATNIGTFGCTIDSLAFGPGFPQITLNYSGATFVNQINSIVGVTAGNPVNATTVEYNLVSAGAVQPYISTALSETIFQDFGTGTSVPAEALDLGGQVVTYTDLTSSFFWQIL
ncbi:MAG: hypothetical protein KDB53_10950 [Planctomycetes bacterium]|nr:hypothetical protein [Planctomycetota bacterium]